MNQDTDLQQLEEKLATLDVERAKLVLEINNIRNTTKADVLTRPPPPLNGRPALTKPPISPAEKISLFLKLFRCREDVCTCQKLMPQPEEIHLMTSHVSLTKLLSKKQHS